MKVRFFISNEARERIWVNDGVNVNQEQWIDLVEGEITPAARRSIGIVTQYSIPVQEALSVDPRDEVSTRKAVASYLNNIPIIKEYRQLQMRVEDARRRSLQAKDKIESLAARKEASEAEEKELRDRMKKNKEAREALKAEAKEAEASAKTTSEEYEAVLAQMQEMAKQLE